MADASHRLVVITGGPGSGKTTLIEALAGAGHAVMPEAGRQVIRTQLAAGGQGLPWADGSLFAELMLTQDLRSHTVALARSGLVFFDRGIPDIAGYLALCRLPITETVERAARACRYRRTVFIAPPWPEIFTQDAERKQGPAEAQRTYEAMVATYPRYGYDLLELPRVEVAERVAFVTRHLS
ncbi:AAA family ATPase [Bosea thiooxidans]|nr:AAA family ATPase [Bosea sp. (in: a-proteobacteria)]